METYIYKTATELAKLIRTRKVSSTDIVIQHLNQIKKYNPLLNAMISVFETEALKTAAICDQEAKEDRFRGPLHGVPVTIKECFWIKGEKSNMNSKMLKNFTAPEDAVVVQRIKDSGAIILGQTNVPKNLLDYQVAGDIYRKGKNPYNPEYTPGGSTGGGAAALAAGFTSLELGSDFGGSVRVPANFCGLYGLKPTEKTVPLHGSIPLPEKAKTYVVHMAQPGPLGRSIEDIELLWKIIVGPHESDRNIPGIDWNTPEKKSLTAYKIAWTDGLPGYEASQQVSGAILKLIEQLKSGSCSVYKKIPDDNLHHDSLKTWANLFPYVIAQGTSPLTRAIIKTGLRKGIFKGWKEFRQDMNVAFRLNANRYGEAMMMRNQITERWENFFKEYDFLICPLAHGPAFKRCKIGTKLSYEGNEMIYLHYAWPYSACFNASGNPVITIPLGLGKEGLPLGVQIAGPYWSEPALINFAKQVAELTVGFIKPDGY